ncbi:MAG: DUF4330 domain-containing protein [Xenococcaceae cyanobacterium MO_188.B19]|nr:DUF4330 domain-containing protein [Xenococcaceae cyanobacterium MO_188.B19]
MKIIDSQGRLFGKVSILDLGAGAIIFFAIAGILVFPGTQVTGIAQNKSEPIEIEVLVRGFAINDYEKLIKSFEEDKTIDIVIRNQPAGTLEIISTEALPRTTPVPQPDGTVKALPDPRPEVQFIRDFIIGLGGEAEVTKDGVILEGAKKVKIGTGIRLEGNTYDFNGTIIGVASKSDEE